MPLLNDDVIRLKMISVWERHRKRWDVKIEGFVIMPEHIHILIRGKADCIRKFMQYSLAEVSRDIQAILQSRARDGDRSAMNLLDVISGNANGPASGKVWKERFRCVPLDDEGAVRVKLEYMHANPVKRGLAADAYDWMWSSYSHYYVGGCVMAVDSADIA